MSTRGEHQYDAIVVGAGRAGGPLASAFAEAGKRVAIIERAAILRVEDGEIMSVLQIAMMGKPSYTVLRDASFAHPALAEALNNLFAEV